MLFVQRFFSTQPQCYLTFSYKQMSNISNITYKQYDTDSIVIFTMFVPISRPKSIYVVSM